MHNKRFLISLLALAPALVMLGGMHTKTYAQVGRVWAVSFDGNGSWQRLNKSGVRLRDLAFGDFNGDGETDVFRTTGSSWRVSYSGTGTWQTLNNSSARLPSLAFGDFNGDGKTDVFRTTGRSWRVSYSGTGAWQTLNNSSARLPSLAFGDFNGDGRTDVFRTTGRSWRVSYSGTGAWQKLNNSSVRLSSLAFGDFNGDGKTDVFRTTGRSWRVSYSGTGAWQTLKNSAARLSSLAFGDFNGNGKTDVFRSRPVVVHRLSISRHRNVTLTNARADRILRDATDALQVDDGGSDLSCLVELVRRGNVAIPLMGTGVINTKAGFNALMALVPGNVIVVNQINWCSGIGANIIGCAPVPGRKLVVVRFTANQEGILWAHEFGHNKGLNHTTGTNRIMRGTIGVNNNRVSASESNAYRR